MTYKTSAGDMWGRKMMKIWGKQETDECSHCGEKETAKYIMVCQDLMAIQRFYDSAEQLDKWMVGGKEGPRDPYNNQVGPVELERRLAAHTRDE